MFRLTFLGTGTSQGVPMIGCDCEVCRSADKHDKRLRCSAMIERFPAAGTDGGVSAKPDLRIIIDAGPDFRYQMLREDVGGIDAILLTHEHKDHVGGLDDIRAFNYFQQKATSVFATERVADAIKKDYDYAFAEVPYPGAPEIDLHTIEPDMPFYVADQMVAPISGTHLNLPVTGFRIGNLAYLTDFNHITDAQLDKLHGVEVLIINALRPQKHISHFNVEEATEIGRRVGAARTYFTHMSHQIGLYAEIKDSLPEGFSYAYDGLKIELN